MLNFTVTLYVLYAQLVLLDIYVIILEGTMSRHLLFFSLKLADRDYLMSLNYFQRGLHYFF